MIRKHVLAAAAAAGLLASAPGVHAAPEPAPAAAVSAHKLELAKRLFTSMRMDKITHDMLAGMGPQMIDQMRRSNPNITDAEAKAVSEVVQETMDEMMAEVIQKMVPIYAETFTEKELEDTVAFYEGPSGSAMMTKLPILMAKMTPMMAEMGPRLAERMKTRLCSKIDCKGTPKASRS